MAAYVYDDYRVSFHPRADGSYDVRAVGPDGTVREGTFRVPMADDVIIGAARVAVAHARGAATRDVGGDAADAPEADPEQVGAALAAALLTGPIGEGYAAVRAAAAAGDRKHGVRLSLSLAEAPALLSVPWEFLYQRPRFLASQRKSPVVRVLDDGELPPAAEIESTVRVLGVVASPRDLAPLDVAKERAGVEEAVAKMSELGRIELDWLEPATTSRLREMLRDGNYHVIHFVGHSSFTDDGQGIVYLEGEDGSAKGVDETLFANLLSDQDVLRLVVLNSCEGARTTLTDPYAGVATTLVKLGVPAVVAMQFEISDRAAIVFARELYLNLFGRQAPIDAAVAEARKAVYSDVDPIEWATPVLFVRDPDVELFRFAVAAAALPPPEPADPSITPATPTPVVPVATTTPPPPTTPATPVTALTPPTPPTRRRWLRTTLIIAATAVAVFVILGVVGAIFLPDEEGSTATTSPETTLAVPVPREHSGAFAVQVADPGGTVNLLALHMGTGAVSEATNKQQVQDTEPDWDPNTDRLAFRRVRDFEEDSCEGICYVVPSGKSVAQLVDPIPGTVPHAPAWAADGTLFYALTAGCEPGPDCVEEIHRVTFTEGVDRAGFLDDLDQQRDELILQEARDVRDLDSDPLEPDTIVLLDEDGLSRLTATDWIGAETTSDLTALTYTPDGRFIVGIGTADGQQVLEVWDREATRLDAVELAALLQGDLDAGGDLGPIDPATATMRSITGGTDGSSVVVVLAGPDGAPLLAEIGIGDGGTMQVTTTATLPIAVTSRGEVQAAAL